ncbi:pseudouridine synthase [Gilbertella persicaria]|uniref:tRNA pseudouridine synthase 1 n=1 Tax=Rhizopus stolonifer TaxID=4846 RepID=A0A367KSZ8_RHIST|nr:pseudouridine synthase [Gilbertella persicaria]KAI8047570.1 pseudouridine synthase [Gilbertella persicaria]RCI05325.1 tRNA pseudouridine synthase 1 [Rhizopus stolonifer]
MGIVSSKPKPETVTTTTTETTVKTVIEEKSMKRASPADLEKTNSKKKKRPFKGKENKKKKHCHQGELEQRPEHLGPKEPRIPKKKVALLVGFNGTGYQGMQINPTAVSIEGILFEAMCKANAISKDNSDDPRKSAWMRAARTDKGVHAAGNLLSLKMQIPEDYDVVERINSFLPPQIRVWGYVPVIRSFHAKNLCDARVYEYLLPTCAFMAPEKKVITDQPTFDNDIVLCDNRTSEPVIKYTTRSSPELIQQRHDYRATPEQLATFKQALAYFEGTHNFHNYTNGKSFKDKSAQRYIMSIRVSDPIYIDGSEWVSIKLHGQSFILHQIRKMISMAMLVTRSKTPLSLIPKTFEENRINIPKAPALGLLLERPIFNVYNEKMRSRATEVERAEIDFDIYKDQIEAFKQEWIYKKIFDAENHEHVFDGYLTSLDAHIGPDYDYLNPEGVIPDACLVQTKFNTKAASDDEEEE